MFKKLLGRFSHYLYNKTIHNYFGRNYEKNVLISYITSPFLNKDDFVSHTNRIEALTIAKVFDELKFNVDVINFDSDSYVDYEKYDLVFGFEKPYENSFYCPKKITRIFYGTGMNPYISNPKTFSRIKDVYSRKGSILLSSARFVKSDYSLQTSLSDGIICLGNEQCRKSWSLNIESEKVVSVSPSSFATLNYKKILEKKNIKEVRKNYLWFGSGGLVHKGLDLTLEAFLQLSNLQLWVCGPVEQEKEFCSLYKEELYNTPNIHTLGFVDIRSEQFKKIMKETGYLIFPSCSEGGSPSTATVIRNGGLFPVVTKEITLDLNECIFINDLSTSSLIDAIIKSQNMSDNEYLEKVKKVAQFVSINNNLDNFKREFKAALTKLISQ